VLRVIHEMSCVDGVLAYRPDWSDEEAAEFVRQEYYTIRDRDLDELAGLLNAWDARRE
jgi:hypothetical protein